MKNFSLIIVSALLTISASAPVEEAMADTTPAIVQVSGTSGATL